MKTFSIAVLAAMSLASFGCKKKGGGENMMAESAKWRDTMCACKDKTCVDKTMADEKTAEAEMTKGMSEEDQKKMADGLSADDKKKLDENEAAEQKCAATASGAGAAAGSGSAGGSAAMGVGSAAAEKPAAGGGDIPQECQDYKAATAKLAACDKVPQATREAMKASYDAMSAGWTNVSSMTDQAKKAMADGCKQGADAIMQSGKTLCGW